MQLCAWSWARASHCRTQGATGTSELPAPGLGVAMCSTLTSHPPCHARDLQLRWTTWDPAGARARPNRTQRVQHSHVNRTGYTSEVASPAWNLLQTVLGQVRLGVGDGSAPPVAPDTLLFPGAIAHTGPRI